MYKKIFTLTALSLFLFLTGCKEDTASCRIDVQNSLDKGDFDAAISSLNGECAAMFTPSDRYFNLASAYMGKAGFGAIDVVNMLLDSNENEKESFSSFIESVEKEQNSDSLTLLNKAEEYYLQSISPDANSSTLSADICKNTLNSEDSRVVNACFYVGFNQTLQATTTISYLTKDVQNLIDSINDINATDVPIDMKASLDALSWATGVSPLPNGSTVTSTSVTIQDKEYKHLEVIQNGETFYRLADKDAPGAQSSTLLTDGYCLSDGNKTACEGIEKSDGSIDTSHPNYNSCYACPLVTDTNESQNITSLLVESLNNGTDVLLNATDDEDIKESVDDFIKDITGDESANAENFDINISDIINYLNK